MFLRVQQGHHDFQEKQLKKSDTLHVVTMFDPVKVKKTKEFESIVDGEHYYRCWNFVRPP